MQAQLNIISESFATVGLKMNARKTEFLVMTGRLPTITISDRAFERRLGGGGPSHTDCANEKITCPICGAVRVRRALARHQDSAACQEARAELARQNVVIPSLLDARLISTPLERPPETFELSTLVGGAHYLCPVVGCPFSTQKRWQLNNHFRQRHPRDTLLWDDTVPHICEICGFRAMSARGLSLHRNSATCKRLAARNTALEQREIQIQASEFILTVDGNPIQKVKEFKYLGRIVSENDDDKPAIRRNIKRARQQWGRFSRLLRRDNADKYAMSIFYRVIVLSVLLFGSETWVVSDILKGEFRSFHHRCARYVVNRHIWQDGDGNWHCPPSAEVLMEVKMQTIEAYIQRRKDTILRFARTRPIYQEALQSSPIQGNGRQLVWWNQVLYVAPPNTVIDNAT